MYKCLPQIDNALCTQYTVLSLERCVNFFAREATYTCKTNTDITYTCTLHFTRLHNECLKKGQSMIITNFGPYLISIQFSRFWWNCLKHRRIIEGPLTPFRAKLCCCFRSAVTGRHRKKLPAEKHGDMLRYTTSILYVF